MMKILLLVAVLAFMLPGSLHADVNGILLKDFPSHSVLYNSLDGKSIHLLGEVILLPEGSFDQKEAAQMASRIGGLPEPLLDKMVKKGIKLKLFQGKLTENPSARKLDGTSPRGYVSGKTWDDVPGMGGSKLVLAKIGSSDKGKSHGSVNLELHELAHTIDQHVYNGIRSDREFIALWEQEKNRLFPGRSYFLNYQEEYFAEAFAMYYSSPNARQLLKAAAPHTYDYIYELQ
ncbi:anthrax toxin lethal factor-related metalloendopeptidase [Mesobacillus zeae]|nr:toxin [Mesobacillus zeae]